MAIAHFESPMQPEAESSAAASSSSSTPPPSVVLPAGDYEVFLSFRGPDVRNGFADHLYTSLARAKIRTFRDEEELEKGEGIAPSLVRAIPESKIYIPILTERYASSKWCLLELAQMVECWKQGTGHLILPIFYFVNPRDVRHQQGPYQRAFKHHAHKHSPQTLKQWKEALREVGQMKGWHVTESRGEGAIVDEVLSKVESHLMSMYTLVTDELVGIDTPVEEVVELLNLESSNEKVIVGIHGMGGIGKTTLSKAVYNKICAKFDRCCYLEDVREALAKIDGVVSLQNKIMSTILRTNCQIKSISEGIGMIKDRVCKHKLILVVDDIDDKFEFNKILGNVRDYSAGSRFIFTTRHSRALDFIPECKLYEPREMSRVLSLQLFSKHAFGMDNPPKEDAGISEEFVKLAAGLPLALKVIGSLLFRRGRKFWEEKFIEYRGIPSTTENVLQERLNISYNDLSHNEKQIFLDIACFFIGSHKDLPYYMWSGSDFYPESGIDTLIRRSLIKLDEGNQFWMHDCIRDLGRAIVKEEDVQHPCNRSRIWSTDDVLEMLRNKEGSERVELIRIDAGFRDDNYTVLKSKKFEKLSGLRYLEVRYGHMIGDFSEVLPNLRCLRLYKCICFPINVNTKKLAVLDLEESSVMDYWKGWNAIKAAAKLKAVNIWKCKQLNISPDLSTCTSLEFVNFTDCSNMKGRMDIGKFRNLKTLRLCRTGITELVIRGGDIAKLQGLEEMDLSGTDLRELPAGMENLSSLKTLSIGSANRPTNYRTGIPRLPGSLKRLFMSSSSGVPNLLDLKELESLSYANVAWIPGDLWRLRNLKELTLDHCPINGPLLLQPVQDQDKDATTSLAAGAALPTSLTSLHVVNWHHSNEIPSLANLCNLRRLELRGIPVAEIRGLGELRALDTMVIFRSRNLNNLNGVEHLVLLKTLDLCYIPLERLPSLANLSKLKVLLVRGCRNLVEIQGLGGAGESLSRLTVEECPSLMNLDGLQLLGALEEFSLDGQSFGRNPDLDLTGLVNLKGLYIRWYPELTGISGLGTLVSLERLSMQGSTSIRQLPDLSELINLKDLIISGCRSLINLAGIHRLESLRRLHLSGCRSITKLPNLSGLKNLETLDLAGCIELTEVEGIEGLESLWRLDMPNCTSVTELGNLSGLKKLEKLNILGCTKLVSVNGIDELKELRDVKMERWMRVKCSVKWAARYARGVSLAQLLFVFLFGCPIVGSLVICILSAIPAN